VTELYVGTSGWSYSAWNGPFYPKGLAQSKWLEYLSHIFNFVEVDSTFYSIPSPFRVEKWQKNTPPEFRFTAKMPRVITHEKAMTDCLGEMELFYSALAPLKEKLLAFVIQLPPSISYKTGFRAMKNFVGILDSRYRYAVEVRHPSWFNEEFYGFLEQEGVCLVWNQLDTIRAPAMVTADLTYVRLIGDRSISEADFGRIQKDRIEEMRYWAGEIERAKTSRMMKIGIVAANNHYAGFGPGTANMMRKMIGVQETQFGTEKAQAKLYDFGI
jgi:uncharacterized protein YecE (DUF72 family)